MPVPPKKRRTLDQKERDRRAYRQLLKTASRRNAAFLDQGRALADISRKKLYRFEYRSFTKFCRSACGLSVAQANRLIRAAGLWESRGRFPDLPRNIRLLCRFSLVAPAQRGKVWKAVLAEAADRKIKPNCAMLERVMASFTRGKTKGLRARTVSSSDMDLVGEFLNGANDPKAMLEPKQMRLALMVGLELLEHQVSGSSEEAAIIGKLQRITRQLFPSIPY